MPKVKVLKEFVDKETGVYYAPGPDSHYEGSQKRVKELGELEFVEAEKKQEKKSAKDGE